MDKLKKAIQEYENDTSAALYPNLPRIEPKDFRIIERELDNLRAEVIKSKCDLSRQP